MFAPVKVTILTSDVSSYAWRFMQLTPSAAVSNVLGKQEVGNSQ